MLLSLFLIFAIFVRNIVAENRTEHSEDQPFKVYRLMPRTMNDVLAIAELADMAVDYEFDVWKQSNVPGESTDIMVPPAMHVNFTKFLIEHNINYQITIPDVQKLIEKNEVESNSIGQNGSSLKSRDKSASDYRMLRDDPLSDRKPAIPEEILKKVGDIRAKYRFGEYGSYKEMLKYMRTIEFFYPNITKLIRIGASRRGLPLEGLKIGYPVTDTNKKAVWIDGNIHAREWASSHTALFFINQLVSGFGSDPDVTRYLQAVNIYIFPCINPDGYEYSRSSHMPMIRLWRKNRSPQKCGRSRWGGKRCCEGVDLNRNFDFHWAETGSSTNPCSNQYGGEKVFSEPEARAVRDFLTSDEMKDKLDVFITLHTYAQMWIHPFSHRLRAYPDDVADLRKVAQRAVQKLKEVYGTRYRIGTGANMLGPASGGSDDWAKGVLGVKLVYLIELRPAMETANGFILRREELIPTGVETWEGIKVVIEDAIDRAHSDDLRPLALKQLHLHPPPPPGSEKLLEREGVVGRLVEKGILLPKNRNSENVVDITDRSSSLMMAPLMETVVTTASTTTNAQSTAAEETTDDEASGLVTVTSEPQLHRPTVYTLSGFRSKSRSRTVENNEPGWRHSSGRRRLKRPRQSPTDPNCRDLRFSCDFWLRSNRNVCSELQNFMEQNCRYTCRICG